MGRKQKGQCVRCLRRPCSCDLKRRCCPDCGVWILRPDQTHRCDILYEVRIFPGMSKPRRVRAASAGEAAVAMADILDQTGQIAIESGTETTAWVRRISRTEDFPWLEITLTAVDITTYHATQVQPRPEVS